MRIFITGGTGFIGETLVRALAERGDRCLVLSRSGSDPWGLDGVRVLRGDPTTRGAWQAELAGSDAVVNLAGARIVDPAHRWTDARKALLRNSRVETTNQVVEAIRDAAHPPAALVSASGINYYGPRGDDVVDESEPPGDDFMARLCVEWEAAARAAEEVTRVTVLRTGPALAADGGALGPMLPLFRLGLGGPWGDGNGWWSWIHREDLVRLILHVIDHSLPGAVNATAPNPVTVNAFAQALGAAVHRPALVRAPAFGLRLMLGEAADALLHLQRVVPRRALDAGFEFRYPELSGALEAIFPG